MMIPSFAFADNCDPKKKPDSFEEFKQCTYREPDTGIWIVDGDNPITDESKLRDFYNALMGNKDKPTIQGSKPGLMATQSNKLVPEAIIKQKNGKDVTWPEAQRCSLKYCISKESTGSKYDEIVNAMKNATQAWSSNVGVRFIHKQDEDNNCNFKNNNVVFDVQFVSGRSYLARAFYPDQDRTTRNLFIDDSAFNIQRPLLTLEGILRHELGHIIGLRHEHTRPEAAKECFEDKNWRVLSPYTFNSVMHYPHCTDDRNTSWELKITENDIKGVISVYGGPNDCS